ncbi:hypothetical protein D9613_004313 [Agrocybe pediades]|uniref:Protein kinase domain-containing protein n=1 Tax=Agrocybe pediades TaxID=84607 RepID=A0A8H4QI83_9AGAR|nr:hypothetical protein D9613_004313 [Agrocybe pediades]
MQAAYPPLPRSLEEWGHQNLHDMDLLFQEVLANCERWQSLRSFFLEKGYYLYDAQSNLSHTPHRSNQLRREIKPEYPFARKFYQTDEELVFDAQSLLVWAATDLKGREVVIKVVSDANPSDELDVLQFLNTKEARADPRNRTIPVIEFLELEQYTFAVMPRWGDPTGATFDTVHEIMQIIHFDFLEQNTAMNAIYVARDNLRLPGLRKVQDTRYALIDFGESKRYPRDIPLEDVRDNKRYLFKRRRVPVPEYPYNPFAVDVCGFAKVLERWVRHIEGFVPALGPFFDAMTAQNVEERLSAQQALIQFQKIYSNLSEEQLGQKINTMTWEEGVLRYYDV